MFRTFGRIAAAAALVASSATITTFAATAPVGAANTNVNVSCSVDPADQTIDNNDTVTITIGTGCTQVVLGNPALGTMTVNGFPTTPGNPVGVAQGDTVIYTAPASGSGIDFIFFMVNFNPAQNMAITFPPAPPRSDSLTDNGDGSMTIAYSALSGPEAIWVAMYASGTTCPGTPPQPATGRLYVLAPNTPYNPIGASPVVVTGDFPAMTGVAPYAATTMPAGSYEACMYYSSGQSPASLQSSLAITLTSGTTPTTTTPSTPVTPTITG